MAVFNVIVEQARLDNARSQIKTMGHDGGAEDATCLEESECRVRYSWGIL
jgi:hypothetical protein